MKIKKRRVKKKIKELRGEKKTGKKEENEEN